MRLELEAFGDVQFSREILRVGQNASDMTPAFKDVADFLRSSMTRQFDSQGRAFSGEWAPLAPSTRAYKARKGLDPRILHATLRLRKSLTNKTHKDHVTRIKRDEMFFGTGTPYARFHQLGTSRMPRRRPFELDDNARKRIIKILQAHLMGAS